LEFLVFGDLRAQRFRAPLHLPGFDIHACQFLEQLTAFFKAPHRAYRGHHAGDRRGKRSIFQTQLPVARAKSLATDSAVKVSALELQWSQNACKGLFAATDVASPLAALTASLGRFFVRVVGV